MLKEQLDVEFNQLFTITNMPIKRFLHDLQRQGEYETYMQLLVDNYNSHTVSQVMCRSLVSVSWDGYLYDCDFNQMLDLPQANQPKTLWDLDHFNQIEQDPIALGNHCYACTAGSGSSCGGALA